MADLPAGARPCPTCLRPIWGKVERCGSCDPDNYTIDDWVDEVSAFAVSEEGKRIYEANLHRAGLADPKVDPDPQEDP